jgi:hypothetical protein
LFESDKWHSGCNFSFYKYLLFPDKLFSWCVWAATAVYKVFRKVLSSLLLKNPWRGERRTCKGNLLYIILYIWWPLTTKGHSVRYVNEQPLWERQGAVGEKYLSLSLSEYEYYIKLGIGPDM